jgi:dienelactone hydrolase
MLAPGSILPRGLETLSGFKQTYPTVNRLGAVGFCWGGKLVSLAAAKGEDSPLQPAAQSSPARTDPGEADKITIPMAVPASAKEDKKVVVEYGERLQGPKHIEIFDSQVHGWMSAR